ILRNEPFQRLEYALRFSRLLLFLQLHLSLEFKPFRFQLIATSLPEEIFSMEDLKEIYHRHMGNRNWLQRIEIYSWIVSISF
ncbi:hypothetical protein CLONEX_00094, partial [[Clostridium] nexile DSM 1787]